MSGDEMLQVPMWGTGEIMDLAPAHDAIKAATDEKLAQWFAAYYKPVKETFDLVKDELLGRMELKSQTMLPLPNGQTVEIERTMKRTCNAGGLKAVEKKIRDVHGLDILLVREKIEQLPDMRGIKKARKLGDEITQDIQMNLAEEPGRPRLKVKGLTDGQRDKILNG